MTFLAPRITVPKSMHYKDFTSKSLFLKDLVTKLPKSLIPKYRTKGGLRDGLPNWSDCQELRTKSQELTADNEQRFKLITAIDPKANL